MNIIALYYCIYVRGVVTSI